MKLINNILKKDYCIVKLDMSERSAYEYKIQSEIPTKIEYGRVHCGKFQEGLIDGKFCNRKLHDIVYLIKRGCTLEEINIQINTAYENV